MWGGALRRTSVFAIGKNLGGGRIHFARAYELTRGSPPDGTSGGAARKRCGTSARFSCRRRHLWLSLSWTSKSAFVCASGFCGVVQCVLLVAIAICQSLCLRRAPFCVARKGRKSQSGRGDFDFPPSRHPSPLKRPIRGAFGPPYWMYPPGIAPPKPGGTNRQKRNRAHRYSCLVRRKVCRTSSSSSAAYCALLSAS